MNKKIFIIWGGVDASNFESFEDYIMQEDFNPYEEKYIGWKDTLFADLWNGFEVIRIPMPNKNCAQYKHWKIMFEKALPYFWNGNILIGHSLWGSFLVKYLSENTLENISSIHLIAPASQDTPDEKLWSFLFERELSALKDIEEKLYFYFSKDDPIVPFYEYNYFSFVLPNAHYSVFENKGHFIFEEHFEALVSNIKI